MTMNFTETLDMARVLFRMYLNDGAGEFTKVLSSMAEQILRRSAGDLKVINGRFTTLLTGLLAIVYVNESEKIIRKSVDISQNFLAESDATAKKDCFVRDLSAFLRGLEQKSQQSLADQVILYLKSCSLKELQAMKIDTLADRFKYNKTYFCEKFKSERGLTLHEAMQEEKLNRALLALKAGQTGTVKELAAMIGFGDSAHFSRLFKDRFGFSPSETPRFE